ncbi:MAG: hypothetical protein AB8B99_13295 [Phormidesmis sp.]
MVLHSLALSGARSREVTVRRTPAHTLSRLCGLVCGVTAMTVGLSAAVSAQDYVVLSEAVLPEANLSEANLSDAAAIAPSMTIDGAQLSQAQPTEPTEIIAPPAAPSPAPTPFSPEVAGIVDLANGAESIRSLGQLRPRNVEALADDDVSWLSDVILPLYVSPGGEHWGWIYQGWLIPKGQTYLAIGRDAGFAMVRAYENLYTFPVLEARADGWFRVQYSPNGSAWAHSSQLALGDVPLAVEGWETQLRSQKAVYFLEANKAQALRSQPEAATNMLSMVPSGSLIEPLDFQGDWMQVRVTRPASACRALTGATVTEGWMRWRGDNRESLVWYRPDSSCS